MRQRLKEYFTLVSSFYCVVIALFLACIPAVNAAAQTFTYQDDSGTLHFAERITEIPEKYRKQVVAPTPLPYQTKKEYIRYMREQARIQAKQERAAIAAGKQRSHLPPVKDPTGKIKAGASGDVQQLETVEVYVSPSCPDCPKLEMFLLKSGIKFKRFDIVKNQKAFEKFDQLNAGTKLPVTKIGTKIIHGLDTTKILEAATNYKKEKPQVEGMGSL